MDKLERAAWEAVRRLANIEDDLAKGSPRWLDLAKAAAALLSADAAPGEYIGELSNGDARTVPDAGAAGERGANSGYAIALQRAIEYHCRGELLPVDLIQQCPHHGFKLNADLLRQRRDTQPPAPAGRDEETPVAALEDLLDTYREALVDRVVGRADGGVTLRSEAYAERRAIHAHVARRVAEAEGVTVALGEIIGRHIPGDSPAMPASRVTVRLDSLADLWIGERVRLVRAAQPGEVGK